MLRLIHPISQSIEPHFESRVQHSGHQGNIKLSTGIFSKMMAIKMWETPINLKVVKIECEKIVLSDGKTKMECRMIDRVKPLLKYMEPDIMITVNRYTSTKYDVVKKDHTIENRVVIFLVDLLVHTEKKVYKIGTIYDTLGYPVNC